MTESIAVALIWGVVCAFALVVGGCYCTIRLVITGHGLFERKSEREHAASKLVNWRE